MAAGRAVTTTMKEKDMYGQNHRYCQACGHAVRYGHSGCSGCGSSFADLMILDEVIDGGTGGIGFDPLDGQFAVGIPGTDLAIEPDGQMDLDIGGFDIPL
jgi:hypothetical protein